MNKCINLPRYVAQEFSTDIKNSVVWISIGEPEKDFQHITNSILDKLPKLKISFHDLKEIKEEYKDLSPPNKKIAHKIIKFILLHKDKNFIINCAAGISRSGAICKFLEDVLNYKWIEFGKTLSEPNMLLYSLLVEAYQEKQLLLTKFLTKPLQDVN